MSIQIKLLENKKTLLTGYNLVEHKDTKEVFLVYLTLGNTVIMIEEEGLLEYNKEHLLDVYQVVGEADYVELRISGKVEGIL